jgi:hypothetical protein
MCADFARVFPQRFTRSGVGDLGGDATLPSRSVSPNPGVGDLGGDATLASWFELGTCAFEVTARARETQSEGFFVMNLLLNGASKDRADRVVRSL